MELTLNYNQVVSQEEVFNVITYPCEKGSSHEVICLTEDPLHLIRVKEMVYWDDMDLPIGFVRKYAELPSSGPYLSQKAISTLRSLAERRIDSKPWPQGLDSSDYILDIINEYKRSFLLKWITPNSYKELVSFGENLSEWLISIRGERERCKKNLREMMFAQLATFQSGDQ